MRKSLLFLAVLAAGLAVALGGRLIALRAGEHGPRARSSACVQTLLVVTLGSSLFDVPIRGSLLLLLFGCSALFNVARKERLQALRDKRMVFILVVELHDRRPSDAQAALESGEATAALVVPREYSRRAARGEPTDVQIVVDATDAARSQVASQDASELLASLHAGSVSAAPLAPRVLYNPRLETPVYMVPGILATLLFAITTVVTAMGLAREREQGTLEQILVTPIRPLVLLGARSCRTCSSD